MILIIFLSFYSDSGSVMAMDLGGETSRARTTASRVNKNQQQRSTARRSPISTSYEIQEMLENMFQSEQMKSWAEYIENEFEEYEPATTFAKDYKEYMKMLKIFESNKERDFKKGSQFAIQLESLNDDIDGLKTSIQQFGLGNLEMDKKLHEARTLQQKAEVTSHFTSQLVESSHGIKDQFIKFSIEGKLLDMTKVLKHKNQQTDWRKNPKESIESRFFICKNGSSSWTESITKIEKNKPCSQATTLTVEKALALKGAFESKNNFLSLDELAFITNSSKEDIGNMKKLILDHLPVVLLKKRNFEAQFVDVRDILANPAKIVEMWEAQEMFQNVQLSEKSVPTSVPQKRQGKSGRLKGSFVLREHMVEAVKEYMDYCCLPAHERRREDVARFGGVGSGATWEKDLRDFIIKSFFNDSRKKPSATTVRRLGTAPNQNRRAAKYYRNVIHARPSHSRNEGTLGEIHPNARSCACMVRYVLEFSAEFPEYVTTLSCDDKCKLQVSPCPMIDRKTRSNRSHNLDQTPVVPDHDLKVGVSCTPRGYMRVSHRTEGPPPASLETEMNDAAAIDVDFDLVPMTDAVDSNDDSEKDSPKTAEDLVPMTDAVDPNDDSEKEDDLSSNDELMTESSSEEDFPTFSEKRKSGPERSIIEEHSESSSNEDFPINPSEKRKSNLIESSPEEEHSERGRINHPGSFKRALNSSTDTNDAEEVQDKTSRQDEEKYFTANDSNDEAQEDLDKDDEDEIIVPGGSKRKKRLTVISSTDSEVEQVVEDTNVETIGKVVNVDVDETPLGSPDFVTTTPKFQIDEKGRNHIHFNRTGPGTIVLASSQFSSSSMQNHMEDLGVIFKTDPEAKKRIVFLATDDGDDYSTRNVTTLHSLGRFWEKEQLFMIGLVKYAPRSSRYNPIERVWAPVTKRLANTILDPEGKVLNEGGRSSKKPHEKINIPFYKDCQQTISEMLSDFAFDGFPWKIAQVDPETQMIQIDGKEYKPDFDDQENLRKFYGKTLSKKVNTNFTGEEKEYLNSAKYYSSHADVRSHAIFLQRCTDKKCKPCQRYYSNNPLPKDFIKNLKLPTKENGALFLVPENHSNGDGSFKTYLEASSEIESARSQGLEKKYKPDSELPLPPKSRCTLGCLAVFKDKAPHTRHDNLMHDKSEERNLLERSCTACGEVLPSRYYLRLHQKSHHPELIATRARGSRTRGRGTREASTSQDQGTSQEQGPARSRGSGRTRGTRARGSRARGSRARRGQSGE